jgi:tetratricopeptide (TPR) repeat protein
MLLSAAWLLRQPALAETPVADIHLERPGGFVGGEVCASCHAGEAQLWRQSYHAAAMQIPTATSVKGAFDGRSYNGPAGATRFFQRDGRYIIATAGPDGTLRDYPVAYTFGIDPLQQYLIALPGGRLQAFQIAWDTRPASAGGQRWFDLNPGQKAPGGGPFWTGPSLNWNYMCAGCHSTALRRGLNPETLAFQTKWSDINVACEGCHGAGERHVAAARANKPVAGTLLPLGDHGAGRWGAFDARGIRTWTGPNRPDAQLNSCAGCHSRGRPIADRVAIGAPLLDHHEIELLAPNVFHPDGQIDDEDFEYAPFLQSRMHAAGVTCSDCHEPHGLKLRAEGNAVCGQCHQPAKFDVPAHSRHKPGSSGSQCTACHMPPRTFMQVDVRHDHSLRVPRPDPASGSPDACTGCHTGRSQAWASGQIKAWYGRLAEDRHAGALMVKARAGTADVALAALASAPATNSMLRATALSLLGSNPRANGLAAVRVGLGDPDPIVRLGALRALSTAPPDLRRTLLWPLLDDRVRAVRINAARLLAVVPAASLTVAEQGTLERVTAEWIDSQRQLADRPESPFNIATLRFDQGRTEEAEAGFRQSLKIDPTFVPAMLNLADLYRAGKRDAEAEALLRRAVSLEPANADAGYALALAQIRAGRREEAAQTLRTVLAKAPRDANAAYALGLLDEAAGKLDEAAVLLDKAVAGNEGNQQLIALALRIARARGDAKAVARYEALQR